jgi:hypothetical protein
MNEELLPGDRVRIIFDDDTNDGSQGEERVVNVNRFVRLDSYTAKLFSIKGDEFLLGSNYASWEIVNRPRVPWMAGFTIQAKLDPSLLPGNTDRQGSTLIKAPDPRDRTILTGSFLLESGWMFNSWRVIDNPFPIEPREDDHGVPIDDDFYFGLEALVAGRIIAMPRDYAIALYESSWAKRDVVPEGLSPDRWQRSGEFDRATILFAASTEWGEWTDDDPAWGESANYEVD